MNISELETNEGLKKIECGFYVKQKESGPLSSSSIKTYLFGLRNVADFYSMDQDGNMSRLAPYLARWTRGLKKAITNHLQRRNEQLGSTI